MPPITQSLQQHLLSIQWNQYVSTQPAIHISIPNQTLTLIQNFNLIATYPCSTALAGPGQQNNSHKTPTGWHFIANIIGQDAPLGTAFSSRKPTGQIWTPQSPPTNDDLILTRILWLKGLEPNHNLHGQVDTYSRYIYIHGTNHENRIGTPASHGCIRLKNNDILSLTPQIQVNTPVYIDMHK